MKDEEDNGPYFATVKGMIYCLVPKIEEFGRCCERNDSTVEIEKKLIDEFKQIIRTYESFGR